MFTSHIQKSITKSLNTHDRRHPLQAGSIDVGDDNVLLQLGRLGVTPKKTKKAQEKLAAAAVSLVAGSVAVKNEDVGGKAVKDKASQQNEKKKAKNPFQSVKKGKLNALKEKSVATSNIIGELKSPTTELNQPSFDVKVNLNNTEKVSLSISQTGELTSTKSVTTKTQSTKSDSQSVESETKEKKSENDSEIGVSKTENSETVSQSTETKTGSISSLVSESIISESHKTKTESALTLIGVSKIENSETMSQSTDTKTGSISSLVSESIISKSHKTKTESALTTITTKSDDVKSEAHDRQEVQIQVKLNNQENQIKANKINKSKFKIFGELSTDKSVKQIERKPKEPEGEVNLISWMKDKTEGDEGIAKPSAIKTADENKIKKKITLKKNSKETLKTTTQITRDVECKEYTLEGMKSSSSSSSLSTEKTSSKAMFAVKEENIEVVERIKTTNIVPLKLEGVMVEETRETKLGPKIVVNKRERNDSFTIHSASSETSKEKGKSKEVVSSEITTVSNEKSSKTVSVSNTTSKTMETSNVTTDKISASVTNEMTEVSNKENNKKEGASPLKAKPFALKPVGQLEPKKTTSFSVIIPQSGTTKEKLDSTSSEDNNNSPSPESTSTGKGMWKTFKRTDRTKKEEVIEKAVSAEDKKKMFKAKRSMTMAAPSSEYPMLEKNEDNTDVPKKSSRPKLTRSMTDIGRQDSLEDIRIEMDELLKLRSWKNETETKTKNKMRKMIVKAKVQWKSYEYEPGQLDYDKYYKMKEKHKELMRLKRSVSEIETGSLDRERLNSIEKTDEEQEKLDMLIRERDRKAEEAKEERIKQKIIREEEERQRIIAEEIELKRIKEEEEIKIKEKEEEMKIQKIREEEEQEKAKKEEAEKVQMILSKVNELPTASLELEKEAGTVKKDEKANIEKIKEKLSEEKKPVKKGKERVNEELLIQADTQTVEEISKNEERVNKPSLESPVDEVDAVSRTETRTEEMPLVVEEINAQEEKVNKIRKKPTLMRQKMLTKLEANISHEEAPIQKQEKNNMENNIEAKEENIKDVEEKMEVDIKHVETKLEIKQEINDEVKQEIKEETDSKEEEKVTMNKTSKREVDFKQDVTKTDEVQVELSEHVTKKEDKVELEKSHDTTKKEEKIQDTEEKAIPKQIEEVPVNSMASLKESIAETKSTTFIDKKIEKAISKAKIGETKPEEIITIASFRKKKVMKPYLDDLEDVIEKLPTPQEQQTEKEFKIEPERVELINLEPMREEIIKPIPEKRKEVLIEKKEEKSLQVTEKLSEKRKNKVSFKEVIETKQIVDKTENSVKDNDDSGRKFFHAFGDQHTFTKSVFLERLLFGENYEETKTLTKDEWFEKVVTKIRDQLGDDYTLSTKEVSSWNLITSGRKTYKTNTSRIDDDKLAVNLSNNWDGSEGSWEVVARGFKKQGPDFNRSVIGEKRRGQEKWHSIASGKNRTNTRL